MDTINILYRNIKFRFNNLISLFITILQPMIWLLIYSQIASETMRNSGIENYTAFILPGLIILVCFGASASTGMMNYIMKNNGSFYRILTAPIKKSSIVLGQILEGVLCSFLEVSIMIFTSYLMGVKFIIKFELLIISTILIFLTAFFMSSLSYIISLSLENEIIYEAVMNTLILPLFFLSSALFPVNQTTNTLKLIINLNPLTHLIELLREIFLTTSVPLNKTFKVSVLFIGLNIITFIISNLKLKKNIKTPVHLI